MVRRGVPFREAHEAVGRLVSRLLSDGRTLAGVTAGDLAAVDERFVDEDTELADPTESIRRRSSSGGGSFESVDRQIEALQHLLA